MKHVSYILNEIASTPSMNEKLSILERHRDNELLKDALRYMCDETCFFIRKIPDYVPMLIGTNLAEAMDLLYTKIACRKITGNDAIAFVRSLLCSVNPEDADVLVSILKKDPNCGISAKSVNKVWKGLIQETPYMRCGTDLGQIDFEGYAIAQTKADGMFVNIVPENGNVTFISRNGKHVDLLGIVEKLFDPIKNSHKVRHGELLVTDENGNVLPRKVGNGILNKAVKGTISREECERVIVRLWDEIPIMEWRRGVHDVCYSERFARVQETVAKIDSPKVSVIDSKFVKNMDEAEAFYRVQLERGEEGAIIKNLHGIWKNTTSKDCIKMKPFSEVDLLCCGTTPHKKHSHLIGSLLFKSGDGGVVVDVGSGLTEKQRELPQEHFVGKVFAIRYNEIITAKGREERSLYLPRIVSEPREDKVEADIL